MIFLKALAVVLKQLGPMQMPHSFADWLISYIRVYCSVWERIPFGVRFVRLDCSACRSYETIIDSSKAVKILFKSTLVMTKPRLFLRLRTAAFWVR